MEGKTVAVVFVGEGNPSS